MNDYLIGIQNELEHLKANPVSARNVVYYNLVIRPAQGAKGDAVTVRVLIPDCAEWENCTGLSFSVGIARGSELGPYDRAHKLIKEISAIAHQCGFEAQPYV